MGGCISTSAQSNFSNGQKDSSSFNSCMGIGLCRLKRDCKPFDDHVSQAQYLSSIPNRIFTNGRSQTSCIFTQQGRKGVNQDAMIVWEDFISDDVTFCGVFDGHGPYGHIVSRKVRDALPLKLSSFFNAYESKQNGSGSALCVGHPKKAERGIDDGSTVEDDEVELLWREVFLKSYKEMDKELRSHRHVDCFCSGSTAVTVLKQGSNLFMGYIGDSRAIMGSKDSNDDSMVAIQLTVDLKPDLPREAERIKRCKGRVFALQDEPEVSRVWLPFDDAPGLAMARAFGDFCLKEYGVISVPEFSHRVLTDRDKFVVLASDGIWDVLSNEEVVEIVSSVSTRSSAAKVIVESAAREWKSKYPTSKMDDCAVVCLFLDGKMDSESSDCEEQGFSSATLHSNHSGNVIESEDVYEPYLQRNVTVRSTEENDTYKHLVEAAAVASETGVKSSPGSCEDHNWSGLEGVTRVNSIVQLPRFTGEQSPNLIEL
ncbi:probable protein phosphatase 2C 52 [Impatiens glandulifera]|uniref:probable protein phosphatase 2C 52 n=1 Tax=Impatiens glandulifera TaxID=253017 RepID=UPI001FB115FA|nr:probable protein phosphatase 2C 52 [Impatiens glandulifera]